MSMLSWCFKSPCRAFNLTTSTKVVSCRVGKIPQILCLLIATCYLAQLRSTLRPIPNDQVNKVVKDLDVGPANTNWKNVQYYSGDFAQTLPADAKLIRRRCIQFLGYRYLNYGQVFASTNNCFGPLATNTTCCYCYISRESEAYTELFEHYRYWTCAVARGNSLMSLNSTNIESGERRVAWITGKLGHEGRFRFDVDSYCDKVKSLRLFRSTDAHCYWDSPDFVLQNKKFQRHLRYRIDPNDTSAKGAGFWFHKSVLLRHQLDGYDDGAFLVYTDIDRIDFFELGTFSATLDTMAKQNDDLGIDVMGNFVENAFTKEDVLAAFNATRTMRESPQISASAFVIRNSPKMRRFIDAWIDCVSNWHMLTDEAGILPNAPVYKEHRHDQSILGLLIKSFMTKSGVVGPPARPFGYFSDVATFQFLGTEPTCPFH